MQPEPKPRPDSVLGQLTPERQAAVIEHAAQHTLRQTLKWLAHDGVKLGQTSLSEWLARQRLKDQLRRNESTVATLLRDLSAAQPGLTPGQVQQLGQAFFSALALEQHDIKIWQATQALALKREQLDQALALKREQLDQALALKREHFDFEQTKFKESLRNKLQTGLDAVADAFKSNRTAMDLYQRARQLIHKETL